MKYVISNRLQKGRKRREKGAKGDGGGEGKGREVGGWRGERVGRGVEEEEKERKGKEKRSYMDGAS